MRRVEVGLAALTMAAMLGTIPAVGGYSSTAQLAGSEFTTVGIVTQVEGSAFLFEGESAMADLARPGRGVRHGDRLWVEEDGFVRLTDTSDNRVTVAGPATIEFKRKSRKQVLVRVLSGSVKFRAVENNALHFENALSVGQVAGEAAVWASPKHVQVVALSGEVKVWHPKLPAAPVTVAPGQFTELASSTRHLSPKVPAAVNEESFTDFLERFDEPVAVAERKLASEPVAAKPEEVRERFRGSRVKAELIEPKSPDALARLEGHIKGVYVDDGEKAPLTAMGRRPAFDAYGQPVSQAKKQASSKPAVKFEEQSRQLLEEVNKAREN